MIDSNEYKDQENKESDTALVPSELHILVTDADTNGYEISKMSDFMGLYAQQLTRSLADSPFVEVVSNIPVADLGIINDVVQHAAVVARGNITLVPDFDSLPAGIKEKLKQGLYSIGDSKQVDGNLRAVIVDENGVRVKDITLKKVINNPGTLETTRSIANQMQMKQIQDTLKGIQEMQSYQLDRDMSAIELMHDNYHYSKENTDCWYTFSKELEPALESTRLAIENKDVYIVSVEDVNDEQE